MTISLASVGRPDRNGWNSARPLYRYVWRATRFQQIKICLLMAVITPLSMASLEFQRRIIDDALGAGNVRLLAMLGAGYTALICIRLLLKYAADIVKGKTVETIARDLRLRVMRARQAIWPQRPSYPQDEKIATAISMLGAETEDMSSFAGEALSLPLLTLGTIMWVAVYLIWIEPLIAAIALVLFLPQVAVVPVMQFTINRLAHLRIKQLRNLSHLAIRGGPEGRLGRSPTLGQALIDRLYRIRIQIYMRKFFITELGNFLDALGPVMILAVGGYLVIHGETQVSTLFVFMSGLQKIADPWDQMITFYRTVSNTGVMFDMIRLKLAETPGEIS